MPKSRMLVAEDDRNGREVLAGLLCLAGLDAATAGDGAAALDHLRTQGRPDFVLLDMALRSCDAPTVVRAIRRDPAYTGVKIFAVASGPPDRFDVEGGRGGIDHWFSKPLDPEVLLRDLNQELAGVA